MLHNFLVWALEYFLEKKIKKFAHENMKNDSQKQRRPQESPRIDSEWLVGLLSARLL